MIAEAAGEGRETVTSSIDYILPANVENLVLVGSAVTGIGNDLDNVLQGGIMLNGKDSNDPLFSLAA